MLCIENKLTLDIGLVSLSEELERLELSLYLDLTCFFLPTSIPNNASSNVLPEKHFNIIKNIINIFVHREKQTYYYY